MSRDKIFSSDFSFYYFESYLKLFVYLIWLPVRYLQELSEQRLTPIENLAGMRYSWFLTSVVVFRPDPPRDGAKSAYLKAVVTSNKGRLLISQTLPKELGSFPCHIARTATARRICLYHSKIKKFERNTLGKIANATHDKFRYFQNLVLLNNFNGSTKLPDISILHINVKF